MTFCLASSTNMEEACRELEELKHEMETLKEKYQTKFSQCEDLRRAHDQQLGKLQKATEEIEKQSREICVKNEEICLVKQMYEDLKDKFSEKESVVKHLSMTNESLKTNLKEELMKIEGHNKELLSALDESQTRRDQQEQLICAYKEEINGLKRLLAQTEKKCTDLEERVSMLPEMRRGDEIMNTIEHEKIKIEDQLKWKNEQFRHLEEAHRKLQAEFRAKNKEWELDKATMFDEISTLQINLDSQTRIADDVQSKLHMCNQALAHEESRRKLVELQLLESKKFYDNVVTEYEEVKSNLAARRDDNIAELRHALATKEMLCKEMEYRRIHLEQDNKELREALKELREVQLDELETAASLKDLRQKFRLLEQVHRDCSDKLKCCKAEMKAQTEKLEIQLVNFQSKLISRDKQFSDMQVELECYHSFIMQQKLENEEISTELMVLKSRIPDLFLHVDCVESDLRCQNMELEKQNAFLLKQLQEKNSALCQWKSETTSQLWFVDALQMRVNYLESVENENRLLKKDCDICKQALEELSERFECFKKQALQRESDLQEDLKQTMNALEQANSVIKEKTAQLENFDFDLQKSKQIMELLEKLKSDLQIELNRCNHEYRIIRQDLDASIIGKMEVEQALIAERQNVKQLTDDQDSLLEAFQKRIVVLQEEHLQREFEAVILTIIEVQKASEERLQVFQITEEERRRLINISKEIDFLEQELARRKLENSLMLELEKANLKDFIKEKQHLTADMQQQLYLAEKQVTSLVGDATSFKHLYEHLVKKISRVLEKIAAAYILDEQEIQYTKFVCSDMEGEIRSLQLKLEAKERQYIEATRLLAKLKAEQVTEELQKEKDKARAESELKAMCDNNKVLEERNVSLSAKVKVLHGIIQQASIEREELVNQMLQFTSLMEDACHKDKELNRSLQKLRKNVGEDDVIASCVGENAWNDRKQGNMHQATRTGQGTDIRVPLKDHNF